MVSHTLVIPTYGKPTLLKKCLQSLERYERQRDRYEVIVVDDGSAPSLQNETKAVCRAPNITYIPKDHNEGFSAAVNTGIEHAQGDWVTLVNNDIVFTRPILQTIETTFAAHPKAAVLGAFLRYPDGKVQHAGMTYNPYLHNFVPVGRGHIKTNQGPCFMPAVTGALFSVPKRVFTDIGMFSRDYFIACEDVEFCLRAWSRGYQVRYEPEFTAVHIEGGTRGATVASKRRNGNGVWMQKEAEAIKKFQIELDRFDIKNIIQTVDILNEPFRTMDTRTRHPRSARRGIIRRKPPHLTKLEIGSGYNPQPGYLHLDVRPDLPGLDYVCDFSRERMPFDDGQLTEILANHVIEHISWRRLPHVLREWHRILKPGGRILLRTPDLEFIFKNYLNSTVTPEWPGDEAFIREHLCPNITASWWANIKLFSGQDYDANFHHVCFDFWMLHDLMLRYGFTDVKRVKFDREFSPGELQVEVRK